MNVSEHIGKELLRRAGMNVPKGELVSDAAGAAAAAERLGGRVVMKAQIGAGKRGKGGGIRFAIGANQARETAFEMIGSSVNGHAVTSLLVESAVPIAREFYAAVMNDPSSGSARILFSTFGGMEIEDVEPAHIHQMTADIREPLPFDAARGLVEATDAGAANADAIARTLVALYDLYRANDAELVEINPLVLTTDGELYALDCKLVLDDSSKKRHEDLFARAAAAVETPGTELEQRARALGLLYIELDGDVAILANGAGLTMTSMDVVAHYGGRAANFMEIGGDAYTKAKPALEIVLANPNVRSLLVNFCGAFAQTDVMARGVVDAIQALRPTIPMAFSIHGTGEEAAIAIVREELGIEPYDSMDDAVRAAISAAAQNQAVEVPQ
ncbi:MAG: ATP-grasp domain-containing protein [Vulcanimicrobiaceae bacterium]